MGSSRQAIVVFGHAQDWMVWQEVSPSRVKLSQIKEAIEHSHRGGKVLLDFNHPD
jgi:hypothetical protein